MAVKYIIEYKNHVQDFFKILISNDEYTGEPIEVRGHANITKPKTKLLHALRGRGLRLFLEASIDLDFTDLYSDKETDFKVDFYRNGSELFKGFVKPDGLYADFISERWQITLDCIDGLGILKNLRFVKEGGFPFQGLMTEFDIIYNCLKRTSLDLPINTKIGITREFTRPYPGKDVLTQTKLNTERFYKTSGGETKEDIMDCEEVLKSILEKYNAVIEQHDGEWFIYRPIELIGEYLTPETEGNYPYHRYEQGRFVTLRSLTIDQKIGSQVNDFYPHHANENQRIEINGAVSAFRVKYDYGLVSGLISNNNFKRDSNNEIPGWFISGTAFFEENSFIENGFPTRLVWNWGVYASNSQLKLNVPLSVDENDLLKFYYSYFKTELFTGVRLMIKSVSNNNEVLYAYNDYGNTVWKEEIRLYTIGSGLDTYMESSLLEGFFNIQAPNDGRIYIEIWNPMQFEDGSNVTQPEFNQAILNYLKINPSDKEKTKEGEWHTAYRDPANSSNVEDTKEVFNGDMDSDIYVGAIKKLDNTNTQNWRRRGVIENKEILELMVLDRIIIQNKPQKVFSGDVYGYLPGLSLLNIDNLGGNFYPLSYEYDSLNNICKFESNEIFNEDLEDEIEHEKTYDRSNVIKPTIV